jgi:hypothetical protein
MGKTATEIKAIRNKGIIIALTINLESLVYDFSIFDYGLFLSKLIGPLFILPLDLFV